MKFVSHLNTATEIIHDYHGNEPLSHFIKKFFSQHKKFGSNDRRSIGHLCYCYFRIGHALKNISVEEKILIGIFLCNQTGKEILNHFKPEWNDQIQLPLEQKLSIINCPLLTTDIFPWKNELSQEIDHEKFCRSFLIQPDLFLRIRPGNEQSVLKKLSEADIKFQQISDSCVALNNSTKLAEIVRINKEVVVQDYSSQQVEAFFEPGIKNPELKTVWDCCAASGGKSIMLFDKYPSIQLTVSDIRESILANLKKRFAEAGIKNYRFFVADLSDANCQLPIKSYDFIIADVPCSGSGTWGRTPEALLYFDQHQIEKYSLLQKNIVSNVIPSLKENGRLVYITCSIFKKENEEMIDFIKNKFQLRLMKTELLKGYDNKADSMFVSVFDFC